MRLPTPRLISWNVAGRVQQVQGQLAALAAHTPDLVTLQEVRASTLVPLSDELAQHGLVYIQESVNAAIVANRPTGLLIASRWPLTPLPALPIPYPEKVLAATVDSPWGAIELHTTHIPPGTSQGWIKIDTLEGLYQALARPSPIPRILCGDFNTPQAELSNGRVVTWAERFRADGSVAMIRGLDRWDSGERGVLEGLAVFDLPDVFRSLHGYDVEAYSWYVRRSGRDVIGRRFDHVFASRTLNPMQCDYLRVLREQGLSDHAPILVVFGPERIVEQELTDDQR